MNRIGLLGDVYAAETVANRCRDICFPPPRGMCLQIRNSLFFGRQKFSTACVPRCTYTYPEIASVGVCIPDSQRFDSYCTEFAEVDRLSRSRIHITIRSRIMRRVGQPVNECVITTGALLTETPLDS